MNNDAEKKEAKLGMPYGTAANRLLKTVLFDLVKKTNQDLCYRCGDPILNVSEMSLEHKEPWLNSAEPITLFFSLGNIAFSHRSCNYSAASKPFAKNRTQEELQEFWREAKKRNYTPEKRRKKYLEHGY